MSRSHLRLSAAAVLLALILGGCGGSDGATEPVAVQPSAVESAADEATEAVEEAAADAAKAAEEAAAKAEEAAAQASAEAQRVAAEQAAAAEAAARAEAERVAAEAAAAVEAQRVAAAKVAAEAARQAAVPAEPTGSVSYANCSAVKAAGAAPIRRGEPGYSSKLDRDGDGVACET